ISTSHRHVGGKTWPRGFFWRTYHSSWFSGADPERLDGFLPSRRPDCDWHFFRRALHVHDSVFVRATTASAAATRLGVRDCEKISSHWAALQEAGKIKGFSTPAPLCLSPIWMEKNREHLRGVNLPTARQTLEETLSTEDFSPDSFAPAFKLLDDLQAVIDP